MSIIESIPKAWFYLPLLSWIELAWNMLILVWTIYFNSI